MLKVLFVAPHADDETLGCGGSILRHSANGDEIHWLIVTSPENDDKKLMRNKEITKVASLYKVKKVHKLGIASKTLDQVPSKNLIQNLSDIISTVEPAIVYLPNRSDIHSDHRITFDAVCGCTKSFRAPYIKKILMYETLSETEFSLSQPDSAFSPNSFADISPYFSRKLEIMRIYKSELMEAPYPRSEKTLEALARFRGSRIGVEFAEAFVLIYEAI
jgi:LmbE family N-acetylglucosaminyl deacetylase